MLVADSLLIHSHTLDCQNLVLFAQPPAIELVVGHDPEEEEANGHSQQARDKEDDLPWLDDRATLATTDSDTVRNNATKDLRPTVKAKPYGGASALLFLCVPLRSEQRESRRHGTLEDSEEEANRDCTGVVLDGCKTC